MLQHGHGKRNKKIFKKVLAMKRLETNLVLFRERCQHWAFRPWSEGLESLVWPLVPVWKGGMRRQREEHPKAYNIYIYIYIGCNN